MPCMTQRHSKAKGKKRLPDLPEDAHLHIGGTLVLRFLPEGQIQVPTDPEKRAMLRTYLSRFLIELEAYR